MNFHNLGIVPSIQKAIDELGYEQPTPIQREAIPHVLAGRDILGCAQTGTGKTAAFSIPILQRLNLEGAADHTVRALILTPTRELALQIYENICQYGRYTGRVAAVIFGGVSQIPQVEALERGVDILVATPGRLWDLMGQKKVSLNKVEYFVLDEADRMLDMGFIHDVKRIVQAVPRKRQTLLFSATMPKEIMELAESMLVRPVRIAITPSARPVERIEQQVYLVEKTEKRELLKRILFARGLPQTLVFTRTKHGADRVARDLNRAGISARSIHGDKSQNARQTALRDFKEYKIAVLVATDIAARGIDISELPLVINFELPNLPETYIHRIGRTGRAGQEGTALSLCDRTEREYLADIEKLIGRAVPVADAQALPAAEQAAAVPKKPVSEPKKPASRKKRGAGQEAAPKETKPEKEKAPRRGKTRQSPAVLIPTADAPTKHPPAQMNENTARKKRNAPRSTPAVIPTHPEIPTAQKRQTAAKKKTGGRAERSNGRGRAAREGRRDLSEGRVDIATPARLDALSDSAAARIRAKVEAKLAERAHVRVQGTASPAPTRSTKGSRTRSGLSKSGQTRSRSAAGRSRQARSALNNSGAAGSRKVTESAGRGGK